MVAVEMTSANNGTSMLRMIDELFLTSPVIDLTTGPQRLLDSEADALRDTEALTVFTSRRSDLSSLPSLPRLRALQITGVPRALPGSEFHALEYYDGPLFEGVLNSPVLRWFYCIESRTELSGEHVFLGPVETIRVNGAGREGGVPRLAQPLALREFDASRFASFDLTGLSRSTELRSLSLHRVDALQSAGELVALPELLAISLESVLAIEPLEAVHEWRASLGISVINKHPFSTDRQDRLLHLGVPWTFPPSSAFFIDGAEGASRRRAHPSE